MNQIGRHTMGEIKQPPLRVLVVDDDPAARVTLEGLLYQEYLVTVAESAESAQQLLAFDWFEIIVSDHDMPGRSGVELLQFVATQYPETVSILLTGHTRRSEVRRADKNHSIFAVLGKPYKPEDLIHSLHLAATTARLRAATRGVSRRR